MFPELAGQFDTAFYRFFLEGVAINRSLNQTDRMHPNAEGVRTIVNAILPSIQVLLEGLKYRWKDRSPSRLCTPSRPFREPTLTVAKLIPFSAIGYRRCFRLGAFSSGRGGLDPVHLQRRQRERRIPARGHACNCGIYIAARVR